MVIYASTRGKASATKGKATRANKAEGKKVESTDRRDQTTTELRTVWRMGTFRNLDHRKDPKKIQALSGSFDHQTPHCFTLYWTVYCIDNPTLKTMITNIIIIQ